MHIINTPLHDVKLLQPVQHGDSRGWFAELFNSSRFVEAGLPGEFVQDNQSRSTRGVLRGLHYQVGQPQGKLVRILSGHVWDVAVDVRPNSPQFGQWAGFHLRPRNEAGNLELLWIPEGFAHGFLVLSDHAEVLYKTTRGYFPAGERCICWNDPALAIEWPLNLLGGKSPVISPKDANGVPFADAEQP